MRVSRASEAVSAVRGPSGVPTIWAPGVPGLLGSARLRPPLRGGKHAVCSRSAAKPANREAVVLDAARSNRRPSRGGCSRVAHDPSDGVGDTGRGGLQGSIVEMRVDRVDGGSGCSRGSRPVARLRGAAWREGNTVLTGRPAPVPKAPTNGRDDGHCLQIRVPVAALEPSPPRGTWQPRPIDRGGRMAVRRWPVRH